MSNTKHFGIPVVFGSTVSLAAPTDPAHAARKQDVDAVAGSTAITGILKGNGSTVVVAVAGTDYLSPSAIGSSVQAYDATLLSLAGKSVSGTGNITLKSYVDAGDAAAQAYADSLVIGLVDDRGNYDASSNVFPSSGGSGTAGAIKKGDLWLISVAGTLGGTVVNVGDQVRATADTPGQTAGNWAILEANIGYVPLSQALASGRIYVGNGSGIGTAVTVSGDWTISNAGVATLANSGVSADSYGSASQTITFTVDGKGRLTAASATAIAITLSQVTDMSPSAMVFNSQILQDDMRRYILGAECVTRSFEVAPGGGAQPTLIYTASVYYAIGTELGGDAADVRLPDIGDFQPGARVIIGDFLNKLASGGSITVLAQDGSSLPFTAKLTKPGQWMEIMSPYNGATTWVLIRRSSDLWSIKTAGFSLATDTRYQTALTAAASASLPASPVAGDWFEISDAGFGGGNGWDVWNLTIPYTTTKINNGTADFVCNVAAGGVRGVYVNSTIGWAIKGI